MNDKQFYEPAALSKISETTRRIEKLRYRMLSSKVPKGSKKVLDIGCGNGELICLLAEKGHKCVALDLSKNRLAKFKSRAKKLGVTQIQGDSTNSPLQDSSFLKLFIGGLELIYAQYFFDRLMGKLSERFGLTGWLIAVGENKNG